MEESMAFRKEKLEAKLKEKLMKLMKKDFNSC